MISNKALLLLFLAVFHVGCSCHKEVITKLTSSDGSHTVTVLAKDCGATTPEYTSVTVRPGPGNSSDQVVFAVRYPQRIQVSWKSTSELVVRCDSCREEEITFQLVKIGNLKVSYQLP